MPKWYRLVQVPQEKVKLFWNTKLQYTFQTTSKMDFTAWAVGAVCLLENANSPKIMPGCFTIPKEKSQLVSKHCKNSYSYKFSTRGRVTHSVMVLYAEQLQLDSVWQLWGTHKMNIWFTKKYGGCTKLSVNIIENLIWVFHNNHQTEFYSLIGIQENIITIEQSFSTESCFTKILCIPNIPRQINRVFDYLTFLN